jgi:hypothetical protein
MLGSYFPGLQSSRDCGREDPQGSGKVQGGFGFKVRGWAGCRVQGSWEGKVKGAGAKGSGFMRGQGSGARGQGFMMQGAGCRV